MKTKLFIDGNEFFTEEYKVGIKNIYRREFDGEKWGAWEKRELTEEGKASFRYWEKKYGRLYSSRLFDLWNLYTKIDNKTSMVMWPELLKGKKAKIAA